MSKTPRTGNNYYDVLGVVGTASAKDIEQAFRKLALQWHPDVCPDPQEAVANFKAITEAYEVLRDPMKRRLYDAGRRKSQRPTHFAGLTRRKQVSPEFAEPFDPRGPDWLPGDIRDLIESFFGRPSSGGSSAGSKPARHDLDIEAKLLLTPEEASRGGLVQLTLPRQQPCAGCKGWGVVGGGVCATCQGVGWFEKMAPLQVQVPPGIWTGSILRIRGAGKTTPDPSAAGDLLLHVQVRPCW